MIVGPGEWFTAKAGGAGGSIGWWNYAYKLQTKRFWRAVHSKRMRRVGRASLAFSAVLGLVALEIQTSYLQSHLLSAVARRATFSVKPGASSRMAQAAAGPYDQRLGYSKLSRFLTHLESAGFVIEAQARGSGMLNRLTELGLFPIHREKTQAGLRVLDRNGRELFAARYPERVFEDFDSIPPVVVASLLFIENRDLLKPSRPYQNPAVEWDRLAVAAFGLGVHKLYPNYPLVGGSTLATQLEKVRHSPGGSTASVPEKLRQMASASLRAYQAGQETLGTQKRIIQDYLNSVPLAALPGHGEVIGLGDGLWAWFGADLDKASRLLRENEDAMSKAELIERSLAYRQALSLLLALNKPSRYLLHDPASLQSQVDRYVKLIAEAGLISPRLRDLALEQRAAPRKRAPESQAASFIERKATHAIRGSLVSALGVGGTYELDRLDLTLHTTLDRDARDAVTAALQQLGDPSGAAEAGLLGKQLLSRGDPAAVIYSFTLYERGPGANLLRVQTDNYDQPLNVNEGTKLELGSTAKLRTLITYLEIVAALHEQYATMPPGDLRAVSVDPKDRLTAWAVEYLLDTKDPSLKAMLEAAMLRRYSASPAEGFFTGGGLHYFANFDRKDNGKILTVREAIQRSVNLVFIRLMRDVVRYYMFRSPGSSPRILEDRDDPRRQVYLSRFADQEGKVFLHRFYKKYRGQSPSLALETLLSAMKPAAVRFAVIYRTVLPRASVQRFTEAIKNWLPNSSLSTADIEALFDRYGPTKFSLADRGYLARMHPLELWLLAYLTEHPEAGWEEILANSAKRRQEVYGWLFKTRHKGAQDSRIRALLEADAFVEIHRRWQRLGYPFASLVPSYATTIGSSGDTPAALAELMGIIVNGGVRYPTIRVRQMRFAAATPHETLLGRRLEKRQRVLPPDVAAIVRKELVGVVEGGTGRRASGAVVINGQPVEIGGKTGTGDNRFETYGSNGRRLDSRVVNRTATFVFLLGDRFFGTVTAYVAGEKAGEYGFTSALPVQVFKHLLPSLQPLLRRSPEGRDYTLITNARSNPAPPS